MYNKEMLRALACSFILLLGGCLTSRDPANPALTVLGLAQPAYPAPGMFGVPLDTGLEWHAVAGATKYRVQVGRDAGYGDVIDTTVTDTTLHISGLEHMRVYSWRIQALGPGAASDWNPSNFRAFGGYQGFNRYNTGDQWLYSTYSASGPHTNVTRAYGYVSTRLLDGKHAGDTASYVFEIRDSACVDSSRSSCSLTSSKVDTVVMQLSTHAFLRKTLNDGYGCSRSPVWSAASFTRLVFAYEGPDARAFVDYIPSGYDPGSYGFIENYGLANYSYGHLSPGGVTTYNCQLVSFNGNPVTWVVTR